MFLPLSFLLLLSAPTDTASKLLQEYISIRTDHPVYGTQDAAKFWMREAKFLGFTAATWTMDPKGKCIHFITRIPSTTTNSGRPILLLHHGDTVPAVESEWSHPPFQPEWVQEKNDWYLYGRGAIDDKGQGVAHWMAIKNILDKPRGRDIYFVMNCGEEISDPNGARAFAHFLVKPIQGVTYDVTTLEKLEIGAILDKFPNLPQIEWMWNEGSFGEKTQIAPYTLVPIATSQKGYWLGDITVSGRGGHGALSTQRTPLEVIIRGTDKLYGKNRAFVEKVRYLHVEMEDLVESVSKVLPLWQRVILWIYPRAFFELSGLQSMVTSWWVPSGIKTNSTLPNVVASSASETLEYRFLGEKEVPEIERTLKNIFEPLLGESLELKIETKDFVPFRRDFFKGSEAKIFRDTLEAQPNAVVSTFITPGITDSRYFRLSGVRAFDLAPFFLTQDEIRGMHGKDERMPYQELLRAVQIETSILEKLVR